MKPEAAVDQKLPLVSCILPTYGRPPSYQHLVEEAVESFLRQDYPDKELILLNDSPEQAIVCDAPGVRVFNMPDRYPSLGEKRNAGVRMSNGDLIAMWDDDDISLPWRLSYCVDRIGSRPYFNTQFSWYMDRKFLYPDVKILPAGSLSVFRRDAFETVGGFPAISLYDDQVLEDKLRALASPAGYPRPNVSKAVRSEVYYIYRWGVSPVHISGTMKHGVYETIGERPVTSGTFEIRPHWRMDYVAAVQTFASPCLAASGKTSPTAGAEPVPVETHWYLSMVSPARTQRPNSETT